MSNNKEVQRLILEAWATLNEPEERYTAKVRIQVAMGYLEKANGIIRKDKES